MSRAACDRDPIRAGGVGTGEDESGVPGAVQARVSLAVRFAIHDVAGGEPGAFARLRAWYRFTPRDRLVWAYAAERDPARKRRLADAYKELTGEDVESRPARLVD